MKMSSSRYRFLRLLLPLVVLLLGCPAPTPPREFVPAEPQIPPITVLGKTATLAPGSTASFLVQVRDPHTGKPEKASRVRVALNPLDAPPDEIFRGETGDDGVVQVAFEIPVEVATPQQILNISADTSQGEFSSGLNVYVGDAFDVLLSTDKPVYQPDQTIHMRALALNSTALKAARSEPLVITVSDPAGNKLMRKELTTSDFGVAAVDFALDSQAASGDYILAAEMGPNSVSRSVEVKPYILPRFEVTFASDKGYYRPGEVATGSVGAKYFFGKPVAGGQVSMRGFVADVERIQVFEVNGETDAQGVYRYEFTVPDYLVGQLEGDTASVDLEIAVTDTANHQERIDESVTVAEQPILINVVPESGSLRPGLLNLLYINTSYPDGSAARTTLTVESSLLDETLRVETDDYGLAVISMTVPSGEQPLLTVAAADANGLTAAQEFDLEISGVANAVLLRPDKAHYAVGETMNVDILVNGPAVTAYLDIVKADQTFGLAGLPVVDGRAQAAIPVDGSLLGTLELHAYVIDENGEIVRDRRLALVNPAPAQVDIQADAEVYEPGDTATLEIAVSRDGAPMPGVVGVSIVDESVFAVGAQEPGFARTYFLLERELQEPRYEIHDFAPLQSDDPSPYDKTTTDTARQVALAGFFAEELASQASIPHSQIPIHNSPFLPYAQRLPYALPLLGLAFYDGTRRGRRLIVAAIVLGATALIAVSCAAPAAPAAPAAELAAPAEAPASLTTATRGRSEPPRLRQFFPETLFWLAEAQTDEQGTVTIETPIADSITTWRVSVVASDREGNLGSAEAGLRVFQDFFVEPDLPRFLTVGDEIEMPVSIYNYLDEAQTVRLSLAEADWFEVLGDSEVTVQLAANEVSAIYIPLVVTGFGLNDLRITASGSQLSDAVQRQVEVLPDGHAQSTVINGRLREEQTFTPVIPPDAVPGASHITVKVYPGVVSQLIAGLEGLLRQPYGCFEQTSSATYPNVMVLDYLKSTGQAAPDIQLRAEQFIGLGYQRLLTFEVNGEPGGFSLFGDPPPQTMLTAYGLMEFSDMSEVSYVDPSLIQRTAQFLMMKQNGDGSWPAQGMTIESGLERMGEASLAATAYVAWALADAGYAESEAVQRALDFIQRELGAMNVQPTATPASKTGAPSQGAFVSPLPSAQLASLDSYTLAMIANALIAGGADADPVLDELTQRAQRGEDGLVSWTTGQSTWMDGGGSAATIETTALAAHALLRSDRHLEHAQGAVDYLVSQRDAFGAFETTQATILALKALILAAEQADQGGDAMVTVRLNDGREQVIRIAGESARVVQQVSFDDIAAGENVVEIQVEGNRALQAQVIANYYMPWSMVVESADDTSPVAVDVEYDRSEIEVNDTVNVRANVELLASGVAGTLLVDLGVPPGFSVIAEDLERLVESGVIQRYELTGRQIIVYLTDVVSGQPLALDYRLQARFPIRGQTPASQAYDYYAPDRRTVDSPQRIIVKIGAPKP
jgi:uncharacterized protein YfaS (alpha-2-macroglobulin family)